IPDVALPASPLDKKKMEFILAQETYVVFYFRLMEAPLAKNGNMKSPVRPVDLKKRTKTMETPEEFRFITSLIQQNQYDETDRADDMNIIKNPLGLSFYYYESGWREEKITPRKISPVQFHQKSIDPCIHVKRKNGFYILHLKVMIDGENFSSKSIRLSGNYIKLKKQFYFIKNEAVYRVLAFFEENGREIQLTPNQCPLFKKELLDKLEKAIRIKYSFIKKAPKSFVKKENLDKITEHLIYLSESNDYILITPALRYGEIEAPILS